MQGRKRAIKQGQTEGTEGSGKTRPDTLSIPHSPLLRSLAHSTTFLRCLSVRVSSPTTASIMFLSPSPSLPLTVLICNHYCSSAGPRDVLVFPLCTFRSNASRWSDDKTLPRCRRCEQEKHLRVLASQN